MDKELTENEKEAIRRCEYASQLLNEHNIPHVVKKKEIGHINLLQPVTGKVVMSFWARTGKIIFTKMPREDFDWQTYEDDRGIKKCIELYEREFKHGT